MKKQPFRINDINIDWTSSDSHYFFNPKHPEAKKLKSIAEKIPFLPGHIYLFTSNFGKICLLSKKAFLCSAKAVNKNLKTSSRDKWLIALPLFHVAGLSILARSFCGGFFYEKLTSLWNPRLFVEDLKRKKITLCSLVPSQIYDLVQNQLKAPKTLRAVVVGGAALSPFLYKRAVDLSWPILTSYGLTESCSQVACSSLGSLGRKTLPKMKILSHVKVKKIKKSVHIQSKSLLTAYFDLKLKKLHDPKNSKGWLPLNDEVVLESNSLIVKGRKDQQIQILGERVDFQKLSFFFEQLAGDRLKECCLILLPDLRQGFVLSLLSSSFEMEKLFDLVRKFNIKVMPFERIENIYLVDKIQKNALFKINKKDIKKQLAF